MSPSYVTVLIIRVLVIIIIESFVSYIHAHFCFNNCDYYYYHYYTALLFLIHVHMQVCVQLAIAL